MRDYLPNNKLDIEPDIEKERQRIISKVKQKITFQTETWDNLDFILNLLANKGFSKTSFFVSQKDKFQSREIILKNPRHQKVRILAACLFGKYIQVEFFPRIKPLQKLVN